MNIKYGIELNALQFRILSSKSELIHLRNIKIFYFMDNNNNHNLSSNKFYYRNVCEYSTRSLHEPKICVKIFRIIKIRRTAFSEKLERLIWWDKWFHFYDRISFIFALCSRFESEYQMGMNIRKNLIRKFRWVWTIVNHLLSWIDQQKT